MPTYFITSPQVRGDCIHIDGPLFKHLKNSLRVQQGESLIFVDEGRQRYLTKVDSINPQVLVARITQRFDPAPPPALSITLAQGIVKGKKMDWIVQKATEIGVSRIVPLLTGRTVVRLGGLKALRQKDRWQAIAHEAAQQAGRDHVPRIEPVCSFQDFVRLPNGRLKLIFWEGKTERSLKDELADQENFKSVTMIIGPEGGFNPEEIEEAKGVGFQAVHLGPNILRAETAALVVLGILQFLWGDLGNG